MPANEPNIHDLSDACKTELSAHSDGRQLSAVLVKYKNGEVDLFKPAGSPLKKMPNMPRTPAGEMNPISVWDEADNDEPCWFIGGHWFCT